LIIVYLAGHRWKSSAALQLQLVAVLPQAAVVFIRVVAGGPRIPAQCPRA
jgi:hypothetical protein